MFFWCLRVICLILLISGTAYGQTAIEGTVHDSSGRVVAKASVSLQHRDSGTALTTVSDSDGRFRFSAWKAGPTHCKWRLRATSRLPTNLCCVRASRFPSTWICKKNKPCGKVSGAVQLPDRRS